MAACFRSAASQPGTIFCGVIMSLRWSQPIMVLSTDYVVWHAEQLDLRLCDVTIAPRE